MLMIVMISKYIWLIAILYKYRPPLCVLHQAKINSGTGLRFAQIGLLALENRTHNRFPPVVHIVFRFATHCMIDYQTASTVLS
jgi:hypothetical protein